MMDENRDTWKIHEETKYIGKPDATRFAAGFSGNSSADWARITATGFFPSAEQIAAGLSDENPEVRHAWAQRSDYTPTTEQVDSLLLDEDFIRIAVSQRTDITPTREQMIRTIESIYDMDDEVLQHFIINQNSVIDEELATMIFNKHIDNDSLNVIVLTHRTDVLLSKLQLRRILSTLEKSSLDLIIRMDQEIDVHKLKREVMARLVAASEHISKPLSGKPRL